MSDAAFTSHRTDRLAKAAAAEPSRSGRAHPAVRVFPNPAHLRRCPGGNTQPPNSPPANISGPFFDRISPTDAAPFTAHTPCRAVPESCRFRTASRNGKAASFRPSRTASLLPAGRTRPNGIAVPPGSVTSNLLEIKDFMCSISFFRPFARESIRFSLRRYHYITPFFKMQ